MRVLLNSTERAQLQRMVQTPRNSKQLCRAEALLALDRGETPVKVVEMCGIHPERLESWIKGFQRMRLAFVAEPPSNPARLNLRPTILSPAHTISS